MGPRNTALGLTLLELLIAFAIGTALILIAVPSYRAWVADLEMRDRIEALVVTLSGARAEAIKRQTRVALCPSGDGVACASGGRWEDGWIVFADANKNGTYQSAGDTLLRRGTIPAKVVLTGSTNVAGKIMFRSDGFAYTAAGALLDGAIDACIATRRPPENVRHVIVAAGSRTSIATATGSGNCAAPANKPAET